nr:DNA repair protein RadC [Rahnella variigena]
MTFASLLEGKRHNLLVSGLGKRLGQFQLRRVSNEQQAYPFLDLNISHAKSARIKLSVLIIKSNHYTISTIEIRKAESLPGATPASQEKPMHIVKTDSRSYESDTAIIEMAKDILKGRMTAFDVTFNSSESVKDFFSLDLASEEREVFAVLFLNTQNQLIEYKRMFMGTLKSVEVHPREIIRAAMLLNANALILAHNHPSGNSEPSQEDRTVTTQIEKAANMLGFKVLDHVVVGNGSTVSFAERGWL